MCLVVIVHEVEKNIQWVFLNSILPDLLSYARDLCDAWNEKTSMNDTALEEPYEVQTLRYD